MDANQWRFLRLRPQNFPHIRIAQLAHLYYEQRAGLSQLLECESVKQVRELLATQVTHYWETHYVFGEESAKSEKKLSAASLNLQISTPLHLSSSHTANIRTRRSTVNVPSTSSKP